MGDADVFVMALTAVTDTIMAVMTWPDLIACENQDLGHQDPDFYGSRPRQKGPAQGSWSRGDVRPHAMRVFTWALYKIYFLLVKESS